MKRRILYFMIIISAITLIACNKNEEAPLVDEKESQSSEVESENSETIGESEIQTEEDNAILEGTYKVPLRNIYIDTPKDYQGISYRNVESGMTEIWNIGYELNVCITADEMDKVSSVEEATEKTFELYKLGVNSYIDITELRADKEETMEINGIPVYRFEGQLIGEDGEELYTVGYAFAMDGIPCRIQGMVLCEAEDCSNKEVHAGDMEEEVRTTVDAMIQTLRNEP